MVGFKIFSRLIVLSAAVVMTAWILPVSGQITTACTTSMISSFTPCLNYVTGSSSNGSSPTSDCCSSLSSLASNGGGCFCLLLTANIPFQVPINRTLAISLPRACNMPSVPVLQCKASVAPLPAPGPISSGPALPPRAESPESAPESEAPATVTPPPAVVASPPAIPQVPATGGGSRPVLTPSSATKLSHIYPLSLLLIVVGVMLY